MAFMVSAVTFIMITVIFVTVWLLYAGKSTQEVVRGRIAELQDAEKWSGITTNLRLVRDEMLSTVPALHAILSQMPGASWTQKLLSQAGMKTKPAKLILVSILLGLIVYFGVGEILPFYVSIPAGVVIAFIPLIVVAYKRRQRLNKFEEIFPDALDMFARAVRAGHAFTSAMEMVAAESPEPVGGEFSITYEEQNYGIPIRDALFNLTDRVPSYDVRFFVTALNVQKDSGGNLAEILDQLSHVIRERFRIRREVQVKTALGRLTAGILISLPIAMLVLMSFVNPAYEMVLFTDPLGPIVLAVAVCMQIIGGLILWRIVQIDV